MSEQAGRYQRSAAGMVGAMLLLLLVIAGFAAFRALNRSDPPNPVRAVDYQAVVPYAREHADFDLVAPASLPPGWRATSVDFTDRPATHWHIGQLTDQDKYVGLEQSTSTVRSMLEEYVDPAAVRGGQETVEGVTWQWWSDSGGDHALVRRAGRTTTLVVGTATPDVLVDYVELLR